MDNGSSTSDEDVSTNLALSKHVNNIRAESYMGIGRGKQTYTIDGAVIETPSSTLSTIGQHLVNGAQAASAVLMNPEYGSDRRNIGGIAAQVQTNGNL